MADGEQQPQQRVRRSIVQGIHLGRWPLLASGLTLLLAVDLTGDDGVSRPIVLAVGCVCVGSGIVLVSWGHHDPTRRDPRARTRATDTLPATRPPGEDERRADR